MKMLLASKSSFHSVSKIKRQEMWQGYLLILLPLMGFFVLTLYPMIWAAKWSWYEFTGAAETSLFVGWENFKLIFKDTTYWRTWVTTLQFVAYKLPIELPLAMILALLLNKSLKGKGFFRSVYFMPAIISTAIVGLIVTNLFDYFGVINALLMKIGFVEENVDWFSNKFYAMTVLVLGSVWSSFGTNVLYFLSALQNIDEELYEAAYLDGAGRGTIFFKITLPLIYPVFSTILLLSLNGTLHTSDYILATTNGAPAGSTYTVMSYLVRSFVPGFASGTVNLGYGCALSLVTAVIMGAIAVIYTKLSNKLANLY